MSMKICESLSNPFDTAAEYEGENLFGSTDEGGESFFGSMVKKCIAADSERAKAHWGFNIETEKPENYGPGSLRWDYSISDTATNETEAINPSYSSDYQSIPKDIPKANEFRPRKFTGGSETSDYFSFGTSEPLDSFCVSEVDCNGACNEEHVDDIFCKIELDQKNTASC
jgi:hypothetical protein